MKKFLKVLLKIIKIILIIILLILLLVIGIIIIFNNKHFKYYDNYKITFDNSKQIENWYEIFYNLKDLNVMFNEFKNWRIRWETIIDYKLSKKTKNLTITIINTWYYENWNLMAKLNMIWFNNNWEKTSVSNLYRYYENWNLNVIQNEKNWVLDWEYFEYYENWSLKDEWIYEKWEKIWIWTGYSENWDIEKIINYDNLDINNKWEIDFYIEEKNNTIANLLNNEIYSE